MDVLCLTPAAEGVIDCGYLDARETLGMGRQNLRVTRAVEMLGDQFLSLAAVKVAQVGFCNCACSFAVDNSIHHRDGWLGQNGGGRINNLELIGSELLEGEMGLVLPGEQHVA